MMLVAPPAHLPLLKCGPSSATVTVRGIELNMFAPLLKLCTRVDFLQLGHVDRHSYTRNKSVYHVNREHQYPRRNPPRRNMTKLSVHECLYEVRPVGYSFVVMF